MFGLFKFICTLGLYIKFSTKVWFQYGFCNFSYCFIKFQYLISIYIELCKRWFGILNCYLKNFHNFCRKKYLKNEIKLNHLGYYKLCSEKYFCSRGNLVLLYILAITIIGNCPENFSYCFFHFQTRKKCEIGEGILISDHLQIMS